MTDLPEMIITKLDDLDIDAMRARLQKVRAEVARSQIARQHSRDGEMNLIVPEGEIHIEFAKISSRIVMQRGPTADSRNMWVGESLSCEDGIVVRPNISTKDDCLAFVDRWLAMLDLERYYNGPLASKPAPGDEQRHLAASYLHACAPDEKGGYVELSVRNPYVASKPEISYAGDISRWLDAALARRIIDQTPECVQQDVNSNSYEFGIPGSRSIRCPNELDAIERMRLIGDMADISRPIRKTKPKT